MNQAVAEFTAGKDLTVALLQANHQNKPEVGVAIARAESTGAWDVLKLVATTPADQAFRPLIEGGCPLVKS